MTTTEKSTPSFHLQSPAESFSNYCKSELSKHDDEHQVDVDEATYQQAVNLVLEKLSDIDNGESNA